MKTTTARTMDEVCRQPKGAFAHFIQQKKAFQRNLEEERKQRIRASRQIARDLSWAA